MRMHTYADKKAMGQAAADCFAGPVSLQHPASILQEHPEADIYPDRDSASLLPRK